jgi:hypothetical protein
MESGDFGETAAFAGAHITPPDAGEKRLRKRFNFQLQPDAEPYHKRGDVCGSIFIYKRLFV